MLLTKVRRRDIGRSAVLTRPGHAITEIVLHAGSDMTVVNMIRIVTFKAFDHLTSHDSIQIAVFTEVLPNAGPTWISPEIDSGTVRPRYADSTGLIGCRCRAVVSNSTVECCCHIDVLWEECSALCISRAMVLVKAKETRNPDDSHRTLLNIPEILLPLTGRWRHRVRCVKDRPYLVASQDRVGACLIDVEDAIRVIFTEEINDELHHLPSFLSKGEPGERGLHLLLNGWITRNSRCAGM